jgi:hypothetical protein
MTAAAASCWLGVGLWLLADSARALRLRPPLVAAAFALTRGWVRALRGAGGALVLGAGLQLIRELGLALAAPALLVLAMAVLSLAVLIYPLRPRWYAASLPLALAVAIVSGVWG